MATTAYQIGFPLYDRGGRWEFVLPRAVRSTKNELRWYRNQEGPKGAGSFIAETGAGAALGAKPSGYLAQGFDFLHIASKEAGKPARWKYTSDTAACVLSLTQCHHNGCEPPDDEAPIVLVSCAAYMGRDKGSFSEIQLLGVSTDPDKEQNLKALKQKWAAVLGGREQGFPILALVLHYDDAVFLASDLNIPITTLTESTFSDLFEDEGRQPAIVAVESIQMPLLARSLDIYSGDFESRNRWWQKRKAVAAISFSTITTMAVGSHFLVWPSNHSDFRRKGGIEQPLGECKKEMVKGKLFNAAGGPEFNLLVLRLSEVGVPASNLGHVLGSSLALSLQDYLNKESETDEWKHVRLSKDLFRIQYYPCQVSSHKDAHIIAQAWGAHAVIWGSVRSLSSDRHFITPSLTIDVAPSLDSESFKDTKVIELSSAQPKNISFPELASGNQNTLLQFMLGLYASLNTKDHLAVRYYNEIEKVVNLKPTDTWSLRLLMSQTYSRTGQELRAIQIAQDVEKNCADNFCRASALATQSIENRMIGKDKEALLRAQMVLQVAGTDSELKLMAYLCLGKAHAALKNFEEAHKYYVQALELALEDDDEDSKINIIIYTSELAVETKQFEAAKTLLTSALAIATATNATAKGDVLFHLGNVCNDLNENDDAIRYLEDAAEIFQGNGNLYKQAQALLLSGRIKLSKASYEGALNSCTKAADALERLKKIDNTDFDIISAQANTMVCLADASMKIGQDVNSMRYSQKAIELLQSASQLSEADWVTIFSSRRNLSDFFSKHQHPALAIHHLNQAVEALEKVKGRRQPELLSGVIASKMALELENEMWQPAIQSSHRLASMELKSISVETRNNARKFIDIAFDIAIRKRIYSEAPGLIEDIRQMKLELNAVAMEARLLSTQGRFAEAQKAYSNLATLAVDTNSIKTLGEDEALKWSNISKCGLERIRLGGRISGCLGLAVALPGPICQESVDCLHAGDIIIRYDGSCLDSFYDLRRFPKEKDIKLQIWRDGNTRTIAFLTDVLPLYTLVPF